MNIEETYGSREFSKTGDNPAEATRVYQVVGDYTDDDVLSEFLGSEYTEIYIYDRTLSLVDYSIDQPHDELRTITARYEEEKTTTGNTGGGNSDAVLRDYSFSITSETQHITHSLETVNTYVPAGKTAKNFNGAVNVESDNGSLIVRGVDKILPVFNFSETVIMPAVFGSHELRNAIGLPVSQTVIDAKQIKVFAELYGKINDKPFREFDRGELMLNGITGNRYDRNHYQMTFQFAVQRNLTGEKINGITGIDKRGWEYLWISYVDEVDDAGIKVKKPEQVTIEKIYYYGDFEKLGI